MLQTVLGGTRASYYRDGGDEYPIRIQLKDAEQQDMRDVLDLTLPNADASRRVAQPGRGGVAFRAHAD
jgi:multidrug efflux pump subunit AcrB